jgi:hypothetical protein
MEHRLGRDPFPAERQVIVRHLPVIFVHFYEVGSITNANGQIKQKLEEIGGTLFF